MTDILYDEDNIRVVRLSCTTFGERVSELTAQFTKGGVGLTRMYSDGKPRNLRIEAPEMDALVEAWTAYKAGLAASVEAEKQRLASVLEEATKLAEALGGKIELVEYASDGYYDLTLFPPRHRCSMTYEHIEIILKRLQSVHADIEREKYMEHHYLGGD
jgi:hypothetical protein